MFSMCILRLWWYMYFCLINKHTCGSTVFGIVGVVHALRTSIYTLPPIGQVGCRASRADTLTKTSLTILNLTFCKMRVNEIYHV